MINKIIDGISIAINKKFGDGHEIHTESIEQGLEKGCFSIVCLNPTIEQFLGKRYFRSNQFCIHYFPKSDEPNYEINSTIEELYDCLELITVDGDLVRGTDMHNEKSEGVLHFFVNYDMFVYKQEEPLPIMETVEHKTNMKG